jgi:alcohol dehydrogenase, propanol-preferring
MLFEPNDAGLTLGKNPITIGHEASGWVVEAGPGVSELKAGDRVGFLPAVDACLECNPCRDAHNLWCSKGQVKMAGFAVDGYFQEYVIVDARCAMVLPDDLDIYDAAPLFCAGVTSYHGVDNCELKPGQWMAVIGCGGLGHLVSLAATMRIEYCGLHLLIMLLGNTIRQVSVIGQRIDDVATHPENLERKA